MMPTVFYWIMCLVILLVFDRMFGKRDKKPQETETPREKKVRTVKGVILAVAMVGLACAISYYVRK